MNTVKIDKLAKDVTEFRKANGLPLYWNGTKEELIVGDSVIDEEFTELVDAVDIVDKVDALIDWAYTLVGKMVHTKTSLHYEHSFEAQLITGTIVKQFERRGIDFLKCWDEVHRSNMSKACKTEMELIETAIHYEQKGISVYHEKINGLYVVKCEHDNSGQVKKGKVLKNVFYSEADLAPIISQSNQLEG